MASTGLSRSKLEMKDSWGAPFVRVVVGRVDVDGEAILYEVVWILVVCIMVVLMWVLSKNQMLIVRTFYGSLGWDCWFKVKVVVAIARRIDRSMVFGYLRHETTFVWMFDDYVSLCRQLLRRSLKKKGFQPAF